MTDKIRRISTGIKDMDKLIEGGFKKNSVNLIAGGAGSGKTIFAIQFLVEGIRNKEPGIYITFEEKKEKIYEDMLYCFGWDLAKYEKEGLFVFLEYTPEQVKRVLIEGGGTIDNLITRTKATRMVIDSITSFALLYKDELTKKEASLALFELIDKWGCTAVLTSQEHTLGDGSISSALEFEVDSIILLYHIKEKIGRVRSLEILKMRGTKHPHKTFYFDINKGGIVVNPKKFV
ncbi:hypothetical protein HY643_04515 [Candidatus Woesearchaeota archaeon]|nr:hypothetical protein [Candidatus Woesearchaeota archaeon]